jgi:fructoselysine 6-kinase
MSVAGVGFSCIDLYENLNEYYPTGNSVDFVIHLSRLGLQTSMVTAVGDDEYGKLMTEMLIQEKVDISHLHLQSGRTAIFKMDLNGKDRVHLEKVEGVMGDFSLTDGDIRFIRKHEFLHTNLSGRIINLLPLFREYGVKTVFDFSTRVNKEIAEPILPSVDYAFFSYQQDDNFIEDYMKWAHKLGPKEVIVTLGEKGSIAYDGEVFCREGIIPVEVINTVGAGDSFCAGYMYGVIQGRTLRDCLQMGTELASNIVARFEPY